MDSTKKGETWVLLDSVRFYSDQLHQDVSVRQFLKALLTRLCTERECFNPRRPWGNSGWEYELYDALIDHGVIDGGPGFDEELANDLVLKLIEEL